MAYEPDMHHRHSIRLKGYDYSQAGAYFVTICAWQRECLFGEIVGGKMVLNPVGRVVQTEWERTRDLRPNIELDLYSIMPNHFHAIFFVHEDVGGYGNRPDSPLTGTETGAHVGAPLRGGDSGRRGAPMCARNMCARSTTSMGRPPGSVGSIIAGFKSASTRQINILRNSPGCSVWQRNYYERVIRNEKELSRAREYIAKNPMKWELDRENPVNALQGPNPLRP